MRHVSLFSGIGGLDLAAEWAGFQTVLQVENDAYCRKVLAKHWPDVPRIPDVRKVHADERWIRPAVVSGGFPCQPFSAAGKRRGTGDDRYLWPELLRIVAEIQPAWVIGENVSGLLSIDSGREIDRMLASLEARDYTPWILHYPAAGVGAPHRRDRVFIVAHAAQQLPHRTGGTRGRRGEHTDGSWWESEPGVGRVANGVPRRVDRLRALGNAVVPQQAYPIFASIAATQRVVA